MDKFTQMAVERMAEANVKSNPELSTVLYAFLGADAGGQAGRLAAHTTVFVHEMRAELKSLEPTS